MFFDALFPFIFKRIRELATYLVLYYAGNTNAAGLCQCLQARRHIHPITLNVIWLGDYITEVNANPKKIRFPSGTSAFAQPFPAALRQHSRTASTTLENFASMPSPVFLTIRPRCSRTFGLIR
jgi:hypothetical protein